MEKRERFFEKITKKIIKSAIDKFNFYVEYFFKSCVYIFLLAVILILFDYLWNNKIFNTPEIVNATLNVINNSSVNNPLLYNESIAGGYTLYHSIVIEPVSSLPDNHTLVNVEDVSASSCLFGNNGVLYNADYVFDGDLDTSWQDGVDDFGENEYITFSFQSDGGTAYLEIYNGNQISDEHFCRNNRIHEADIIVNNIASGSIILEDSTIPQLVKISGLSGTTNIKLVIKSVYSGSEYNDTCLSEIKTYSVSN